MLPVVESKEILLEIDLATLVIRWRGQVDRLIAAEFVHGGIKATCVLQPVASESPPIKEPKK